MSNYSSKTKVPVAVKTRSSMDLSHITIASQDFGNIVPISCQYLVPGDEFNIKVSEFTRVLPMVNPTFAKVDSIVRGFVIPINYIWKGFNNFISQLPKTVSAGANSAVAPSEAPCFYITNFRDMFINSVGTSDPLLELVGSSDAHDFSYVYENRKYAKFTAKGKKIYKHFCALGYNFDFSDTIDISFNQMYAGKKYSLLPLLAFAKFYLDWVVPARFLDQFYPLASLIEQSYNMSGAVAGNLLEVLAKTIYDSFLDNDYFTAAWKEPNDYPNASLPGFDSSSSTNHTVSEVRASKDLGAYDNYFDFTNSLTVQSLGRLQSMVNRNMIAGDKIKDWLKVEFGIEPNLDSIQMSTYLGMFRNTMRISDIMSTADTEQSGGLPLGSYAGRAIVGGDGNFSYKAKQHCILILTHEIIPKPLYYLGVQPAAMMTKPFDFFVPEYDNLGCRAISNMELYSGVDKSGGSGGEVVMDKIFGFAPQYANLKFGFDNVIGDFRLKSLDASMSSWFLGRKFTLNNILNSTPNINMSFCKVNGTTQSSYDDIFAYQGTDIDHFYSLFDISIHANRPMVSISDALTLDEEMNDRKVSVSTNNNPNV